MKRVRKKPNTASGFTLAETLMTVLILLMVSAVVAAGIPAASSAYAKVVDGANAQVLLSTTVTALRDELAVATEVTVADGAVTYRGANGARSRLSLSEEGILLEEYLDLTEAGSTPPSRQLVSKKAASDRLYAQWEGISVADGVITVTGLKVKKTGDTAVIAALDTLKIRMLLQG